MCLHRDISIVAKYNACSEVTFTAAQNIAIRCSGVQKSERQRSEQQSNIKTSATIILLHKPTLKSYEIQRIGNRIVYVLFTNIKQ